MARWKEILDDFKIFFWSFAVVYIVGSIAFPTLNIEEEDGYKHKHFNIRQVEDDDKRHMLYTVWIPIILIVVGLLIEFVYNI